MIDAAIVPTLYMVNKYFGVDVPSVAMDGAAPELNPGRVHRRININPEARYAPIYFLSAPALLLQPELNDHLPKSKYGPSAALKQDHESPLRMWYPLK